MGAVYLQTCFETLGTDYCTCTSYPKASQGSQSTVDTDQILEEAALSEAGDVPDKIW